MRRSEDRPDIVGRGTEPAGAWDPTLFQEFRAAAGLRRRWLKNRLLQQNWPLIRRLVAQLTGLQAPNAGHQARGARHDHPVIGADRLEWDDAYQAGLIGFDKALEAFDPAKAKIAGYARWKIMYELQKLVRLNDVIMAPEKKQAERPQVDLVERFDTEHTGHREVSELMTSDTSVLRVQTQSFSDWSRSSDDLAGVTAEKLAEWDRTGQWPEWEPPAPPPAPMAPPSFARDFINRCLQLTPPGRLPAVTLMAAWERAVVLGAARADRRDLLQELAAAGLRWSSTRVPWSDAPVRALCGARLR